MSKNFQLVLLVFLFLVFLNEGVEKFTEEGELSPEHEGGQGGPSRPDHQRERGRGGDRQGLPGPGLPGPGFPGRGRHGRGRHGRGSPSQNKMIGFGGSF